MLTCIVPLLSSAWGNPVITKFEMNATTIRIEFSDGIGTRSRELEENPGLDPADWSPAPSATLNSLGNGRFRFTIARGDADRRFFRVISRVLGTANDRDGDGLPNDLEVSFTSNPSSLNFADPDKFDTDGDGFSDGFEYAQGTRINDATDFPQISNLPAISFAAESTLVTEGDGTIQVALTVESGRTFNGPVRIVATDIGTAVDGVDFVLSPTGTVSGSSGSAPVSLIDNLTVSQDFRLLILEIDDSLGGYIAGGRRRTTVLIGDNDNYWTGSLQDGGKEALFRMVILRGGGVTQASFVAGTGNDGLGVPPGAGASSQSEGIIPAGVHPAATAALSSSAFEVASAPMPAARASLFGADTDLRRTIHLSAVSVPEGPSILPDSIIGTYRELLADPSGGAPHLTLDRSGGMILIRDIPRVPDIDPLGPNN